MAKKKSGEKFRTFFRGPIIKQCKVASEDEDKVISRLVTTILPLRNSRFKIERECNEVIVKPIFGLNQALRSIKQSNAVALIIDETTLDVIQKHMTYLCHKLKIPLIRSACLSKITKKLDFNSLLVFGLVKCTATDNQIEEPCKLQELDSLIEIMSEEKKNTDDIKFDGHNIEKVVSSNKSASKKSARKKLKLEKLNG